DGDQASIGLTDPIVAPRSAERLERHAGVRGDTHAERVVLANLALRAWVGGADAARTRDVASRALAGGALLVDETSDSVPLHQAIFALIIADGLDEADEQLAASIDEARRRGSAYGFAASSTMRALARLRAGRVTDAEADARAALDTEVEHALITPMSRGFLALALLESDAIDEASAVLDAAPPRALLLRALPSIHVCFARGMVALRRGDLQEARAEIEAAASLEGAFGVVSPILGWRLVLAAIRAGSGDVAAARTLVDEQVAHTAAWGSPALHGSALRAEAMFHAGEEGLQRRRAAIALLRAGRDRLELARALTDLGAATRHAGDAEGARAPLTEALDLARALGARALAERAHRQLQAAGARPRRLRFSGAEALTASERRVAELAARGMSNRDIAQALFVTAKTVENHLGRAYRKVGVSSREELGVALGDPHATS
ncbi:MAG TPA: helix-turn-helix transcriptional regulator, partial [Solirubrobacteraceae bacterium]|nr:helix-turn-helix transcriptional regulator [Solirubrobacteraceae bacterium]